MKRNKRGITLIALIITVIVLLILAGVTMSFVVGDNGVVTQAQKAKIRTEEEEAKEEIEIEVVGCYNDSGEIDLGLLNESLKKKGGVSFKKTGESDFVELKDGAEGEEGNQIESLPVTLKYKDVEIEITGEYTGGVDKPILGTLITEAVKGDDYSGYGKYVDYGLDLNGDDDTTNDWRIFYVGTDNTVEGKIPQERVFLIAADYVPKDSCDALKSALASSHLHVDSSETGQTYKWVDDIPDYHCNDNHNLTLNSEKDQCSFPEIFMPSTTYCENNNHYYCSSHTSNINSKCASALQCTGNWSSFKTGYADYAIGGPTLEMWVASWNQKHGTEKTLYANGNENSDDKEGYYVGDHDGCTDEYYYVDDYDGYSDSLYFPHHEGESLELFDVSDDYSGDRDGYVTCYAYWLASPSAGMSSNMMCVDCNGLVSDTSCNYDCCGVRPVVSLKPRVKVEWKSEDGANSNNGYYEIVGNN